MPGLLSFTPKFELAIGMRTTSATVKSGSMRFCTSMLLFWVSARTSAVGTLISSCAPTMRFSAWGMTR